MNKTTLNRAGYGLSIRYNNNYEANPCYTWVKGVSFLFLFWNLSIKMKTMSKLCRLHEQQHVVGWNHEMSYKQNYSSINKFTLTSYFYLINIQL